MDNKEALIYVYEKGLNRTELNIYIRILSGTNSVTKLTDETKLNKDYVSRVVQKLRLRDMIKVIKKDKFGQFVYEAI